MGLNNFWKLYSITLQNFKGIQKPVTINLKPITMLFGPNSAGKSTIIQALHYAHEIFERGNTDPGTPLLDGETINLGGLDKRGSCISITGSDF
jgi:AAA15 family ATPase/GTPase